MKPKFLTVDDLIHELGIGRTTAYQIIKKMKHSKLGRRILVAEEDLLEYLRTQNAGRTTDSKN